MPKWTLLVAVTTFPTACCSRACVSVIRRSCGTVDSAGLSYLSHVRKLEDSLVNFVTQKNKQAKLADLFYVK